MRWEATLIRRGRGGESLAPGAGGGDFDGRGYQPRTSSSRDPRQLTLPPGGPDPRFDSPQYSQRPPQYTHRTPQYDYRTGPQYDHRTPQCEQRTPQCEQSAPQYDQWTPQYERGTPAHPPTIYFYERHQPYYGFTNFSPYEVRYKGKVYPTSEHLFQAMKVCAPVFKRSCCASRLSLR
ncbi:hypothetical protein FRB95_013992 [Tulasnella sp. JGI-2019a]|nr:hypothetical protein FRB95_013992 [Tulasnella sp. JGI-2019a]